MRVAAYCRVSTDSSEQLESIENQKLFFEDFAGKNKYTLTNIYADEGISGRQLGNRTNFIKMLKDARLGMFDMVVVKDISRFARNTVDFLNSIRSLKSLGVDVKFISNNQTILGDSEFILTIFSAMAQEESANLSKRVKFGKKINAKKGRVPVRIYGYRRIDNFTLVPDKEESAIVRRIFEMYVNKGAGAGAIAKQLHDDGVPSARTKSPASWNSKTIRRILSNSIYIGDHVNNKSEVKDYLTGQRAVFPEEEYLHHHRPEFRIISDELFYTAQDKMNRQREIYKSDYMHVTGRESTKHLLSTLIRCKSCGRAFSRRSTPRDSNRAPTWVCTNFNNRGPNVCNNRTKIKEDYIIKFLQDYFFTDKAKEYVIEKLSNADFSKNAKQIGKLKSNLDKYKDMYLNEIIGLDELKKLTGEARLKIIGYEKLSVPIEPERIDFLLCIKNWNNMALKSLVKNIIVDDDGRADIFIKDFQI